MHPAPSVLNDPELDSPVEAVEHYTDAAAGIDREHAAHPFPVRVVESVPAAQRAADVLTCGRVVVPAAGSFTPVVPPELVRRAITLVNHGGQSVVVSNDPGMAAAGIGVVLLAGMSVRLVTTARLYASGLTVAGELGYASESQPY